MAVSKLEINIRLKIAELEKENETCKYSADYHRQVYCRQQIELLNEILTLSGITP
jgi:hypothetical protein